MLAIFTNFLIGVFGARYVSVASATGVSDDNKCGQKVWLRRECPPGKSAMAWGDVCQNRTDHHNFKSDLDLCADNAVCEDILDIDANNQLIETIQCVALVAPGTERERRILEFKKTGDNPISNHPDASRGPHSR
jgi:hypothetical protein